MELSELTQDEVKIIMEYRQKNEAETKRKRLTLEFLKVAYDFKRWLDENGAGATYSTFCDDYGYEGDYRKRVYETALDLINSAWAMAE